MCMKIFSKVSYDMYNSYNVTKVLLKHLKAPISVHSGTNSVTRQGPILLSRNASTDIDTQADIKQNAGNEDLGTKKIIQNCKPRAIKEKSSKDVLEYLNSKDSLKSVLGYLPHKLLKRTRRTPDVLYSVDRDNAKKVVNLIALDILKGRAPVFEANPGLGLISRELLAAGVQRLWLCEPSLEFSQQVKELKNKFPEQVEVIEKDLFTLGKLNFQDNLDGGSRVQSLFHGVPKAEWKDEPVMKIIGVLPSLSFIKYVLRSYVFQTGIIAYGRPEFYFVMSPTLYFYLTCHTEYGYFHYKSNSVLFQLIFEWRLLEKLPRAGFLPWEMKKSTKKWSKLTKVRNIDPDFMYLVKIVPRQDFFQKVASVDQLPALFYFVRHNLRSRKNRVIPQLEKWIPGCGPRIIGDEMTIFTEFGDLTPQEILSVFHKFVSWPEYPICPFLDSMETTFDNIGKDFDDQAEEDDEDS